jgi:hypothetical protein
MLAKPASTPSEARRRGVSCSSSVALTLAPDLIERVGLEVLDLGADCENPAVLADVGQAIV